MTNLIIMKMVRDCGGCAAGGGQRGVGCCRGQRLSGLLPLTVWKRCGPPLQPRWILHVRWCYEAPPVCYAQVRVRTPGAFYWFSRTTAPTTLDPYDVMKHHLFVMFRCGLGHPVPFTDLVLLCMVVLLTNNLLWDMGGREGVADFCVQCMCVCVLACVYVCVCMWVTVFLLLEDWCMCACMCACACGWLYFCCWKIGVCVRVCVRVHVGDCISAVGRLVYVCVCVCMCACACGWLYFCCWKIGVCVRVCVCVCVHVGDCISAVGRLVYVCMCMFTGDYFCCWNICIIP